MNLTCSSPETDATAAACARIDTFTGGNWSACTAFARATHVVYTAAEASGGEVLHSPHRTCPTPSPQPNFQTRHPLASHPAYSPPWPTPIPPTPLAAAQVCCNALNYELDGSPYLSCRRALPLLWLTLPLAAALAVLAAIGLLALLALARHRRASSTLALAKAKAKADADADADADAGGAAGASRGKRHDKWDGMQRTASMHPVLREIAQDHLEDEAEALLETSNSFSSRSYRSFRYVRKALGLTAAKEHSELSPRRATPTDNQALAAVLLRYAGAEQRAERGRIVERLRAGLGFQQGSCFGGSKRVPPSPAPPLLRSLRSPPLD